jgi:hypothetical protein
MTKRKLFVLLLDAFNQTKESEERMCPVSEHGLWRDFQVIRRRAGLEKGKDAFKVM